MILIYHQIFLIREFKDFKASILHTNHRDIIKMLLFKKNINQTLRFMLVDLLKHFESKLITKLRKIHTRYSTLLKKLLLFFEKD